MSKNNNITVSEHKRFWDVVDRIAQDNGISTSRLALRAGLDATSFNKSKRVAVGYCRTPNMTTVLAILRACNLTWHDWAKYWDSVE